MKKTNIYLRFTALNPRISLSLAVLLFGLLATSACSIKERIKVAPSILQARTAGFEELVHIVGANEQIRGLACNEMHLTYTSLRKIANGELEKYRTVKGYVLLRRPDSVHLVLLLPVTESKLFDVLSVGDSLAVWSPRENKFYRGRNSAKELIDDDPAGARELPVQIRGNHIYEAIFPQSIALDSPGVWVSKDEQKDERASYYILTFTKEGIRPRAHTVRRIWIERAGLTIARQQIYTDEGQTVSDIVYSDPLKVGEVFMPQKIHIERPIDGYTLDLSFKNWRVNPELGEEAFQLQPPPGAKVVELKEKTTGR